MKLSKVKKVLISVLILSILLPLALLYFSVSGFKIHLKEIEYYSYKYGVDKHLVLAIIKTESGFDPSAVSSKGAVGIMQIMPSTAKFIAEELGVENYDLKDAKTSINFGTYYLSLLKKKYGEEHLIVSAYNAGEGRVDKWLKQGLISKDKAPFLETERYLKRVKIKKKLYKIIVK